MILQTTNFPHTLLTHSFPIGAVTSSHGTHSFVQSIRIPTTRKASSTYRQCFIKSAHVDVRIQDVFYVFQNKVLIAAVLSAAVGQLIKPFASTILYRKDFNFMVTIQSGGFPSTHSSTVVAAATCLGLERGFADSIFGLAVVYAGIIMYDAQGVRREAGIHAKILNKALLETQYDSASSSKASNDSSNIFPNKSRSNINTSDPIFVEDIDYLKRKRNKDALLLEDEIASDISSIVKEAPKAFISSPLKESIGHTEVEVIAGAFLGFLIGLAVSII